MADQTTDLAQRDLDSWVGDLFDASALLAAMFDRIESRDAADQDYAHQTLRLAQMAREKVHGAAEGLFGLTDRVNLYPRAVVTSEAQHGQ